MKEGRSGVFRPSEEEAHFVDTSAPRMLQGKGLTFPSQPGPVAQLGARMTGSHEVEGSNPSRSTNYLSDFEGITGWSPSDVATGESP